MNQSVNKAAASIYEERRNRADIQRRQRLTDIYSQFPELKKLDREIAIAGAEMLFEAIDPDKPNTASEHMRQLKGQRKQFLLEQKIDLNFDKPKYVCNICNDTGWNGSDKCSCYRKTIMPLLIDHANLKALRDITFDLFDPKLFSDKIDERNGSLSPRQNIIAIRNAVESFADTITETVNPDDSIVDGAPQNLLFLGRPGTGKSFLMACLANHLLVRGETVFYVSSPELFEILNELRVLQRSFNPDPVRLEQVNALYDSIIHARLLLIDDLGTETRAGARYTELLTLVDRRLTPGLHTVISSNADAVSLKQSYDERLLSRLMGHFAIYKFFGDDVRLEISRRRRSRPQ